MLLWKYFFIEIVITNLDRNRLHFITWVGLTHQLKTLLRKNQSHSKSCFCLKWHLSIHGMHSFLGHLPASPPWTCQLPPWHELIEYFSLFLHTLTHTRTYTHTQTEEEWRERKTCMRQDIKIHANAYYENTACIPKFWHQNKLVLTC